MEIAVAADYGVTVVNGAPPEAYRLAMFILSDAGQKILVENGFSSPFAQVGEAQVERMHHRLCSAM